MKKVKGESSICINQKGFLRTRFAWQEGYGAFSYAKSQVPQVIRYIQNQKEHHKMKSFIQEYKEFLKEFGVEYEEQYIFKSCNNHIPYLRHGWNAWLSFFTYISSLRDRFIAYIPVPQVPNIKNESNEIHIAKCPVGTASR